MIWEIAAVLWKHTPWRKKDMSTFVICPSCNEENVGSAVLCRTCRSSLIGAPRQERQSGGPQIDSAREPVFDSVPVKTTTTVQPAASTAGMYGIMFEKIRSWGVWSLVLGA